MYGRSNHHKIEAIFKAFARALRAACSRDKQLGRDASFHQGTALMRVTVIDYKAGNLTSVLKRCGISAQSPWSLIAILRWWIRRAIDPARRRSLCRDAAPGGRWSCSCHWRGNHSEELHFSASALECSGSMQARPKRQSSGSRPVFARRARAFLTAARRFLMWGGIPWK